MIKVEELNPDDDAQFASWYTAFSSGAAAGRSAPVIVPEQAMRTMLTHQERGRRRAFGVFDGDVCQGAALVEWDTEQNTHLGEVEICVPSQDRRRGVGSALLDRIHAQAGDEGLTTLVAEIDAAQPDWPGLHFAAHHGFVTVHTENRLVLDLPLDAARLDVLATGSDARQLGYTLTSWTGATRESLLETMAALQTRMNAEVPTGELNAEPEIVTPESLEATDRRLASRGYESIRTIALAPNGQPAGYSHMIAMEADPVNAKQDDTYVLTAHRGHRLGVLLKTANLEELQRDKPQVRHVHTWTAERNSPMQAINADFGFRSVEIMHEVQYRSQ